MFQPGLSPASHKTLCCYGVSYWGFWWCRNQNEKSSPYKITWYCQVTGAWNVKVTLWCIPSSLLQIYTHAAHFLIQSLLYCCTVQGCNMAYCMPPSPFLFHISTSTYSVWHNIKPKDLWWTCINNTGKYIGLFILFSLVARLLCFQCLIKK